MVDKAFRLKLCILFTQRSQLGNERNALYGSPTKHALQLSIEGGNVNHSFLATWNSTFVLFFFILGNGRGFFFGVKDNVTPICSNTKVNE